MILKEAINAIILSTNINNSNELMDKLDSAKKIAIFGSGSFGKYIFKGLENLGYRVNLFIDNDSTKWETQIDNIPIYSVEKLFEINDDSTIILICSTWFEEIEKQLQKLNIHNFEIIEFGDYYHLQYSKRNHKHNFSQLFHSKLDDFQDVYNLWEDTESLKIFEHIISYRSTANLDCLLESKYKQYFHPLISPTPGDIIIDGGAFVGDTAEVFDDFLNSECVIYSFEPSNMNFSKMKEVIGNNQIKNIIPVNSGLGEYQQILFMNSASNEVNPGNSISTEGSEEVQINSIDQFVSGNNIKKVDLIKLDIEGFELSALKGARNTIIKYRPRLQICLYHRPEDMIDIPKYIKETFGDLGYKYYLGHHTKSFLETVLYATCE